MALLHLGLGQLTHCPRLGTFPYLTQRGEQPGFFSPTPRCPSTLLFLALKERMVGGCFEVPFYELGTRVRGPETRPATFFLFLCSWAWNLGQDVSAPDIVLGPWSQPGTW